MEKRGDGPAEKPDGYDDDDDESILEKRGWFKDNLDGPISALTDLGKPWTAAVVEGSTPRECRIRSDGIFYRGTQSTTANGNKCAKWNELDDILGKWANGLYGRWYADTYGTGDHNYCRTAGNERRGAYCFVSKDINAAGWEKCDIPMCSRSEAKSELTWCELKKKAIGNVKWSEYKYATLDGAKAACELWTYCTGVLKIDCRGADKYRMVSGWTASRDWKTSYTPCKSGSFSGQTNDYVH